jgi:hypothetical protein
MRGGKRNGSGRKKGSPNKATAKVRAEVKELALEHVPAVIEELARLATRAESEAARVSAIKELLDRAYGKSPQALTGDGGGPIQHQVGVSWMTESQAKARGWV